ncbi:hypothetical protein M408DRAFT_12930 [Serendipita vermifera MAFF 305830]|uniref:Uncharacterized protein n=1 Tax=Serendipita vermifera MAFF 305830 TaxID=933852 RepID=A0A0C3AMY7_SERVB|nr:hypothetical protein M408DRAFT_12930 [Serendipita vermifera MAFF 305830]
MLNVECYEGGSHQRRDDTLSIEDPIIAAPLHTLCLDGTDFTKKLLCARPIQRLCLDSFTRRIRAKRTQTLHFDITQSPGELTYLFLIDLLQWLPMAIEQDPEPYRNLRFVGTVIGVECDDEKAFDEMESLSSLDNLETLEVNGFRLSSDPNRFTIEDENRKFKPKFRFFALLQTRHPLLRRVLLTFRNPNGVTRTGESFLWEKSRLWNSRRVPYLEYWDIICNRLESPLLVYQTV